MHEPAVANGSEQKWEREVEAENASAEVAIGEGDGVARAKRDILIDAAVFAEGDFTFGATVEVVENRSRHAALGDGAEV
jgi:hypothetical protein